ncbi:Ribonucleoside-diphosphate reductase subunit M2, partial [Mucuna pruriens]
MTTPIILSTVSIPIPKPSSHLTQVEALSSQYSSHRYGKFTRRQRLHFGQQGRWTSLGTSPNGTISPWGAKFHNSCDCVFFAIGDGIILENLASRFMNEVQVPEARAFYRFQIAIENVHSECTSSYLIPTSKTRHKRCISSAPLITSLLSPYLEKFLCHILAIKPCSFQQIWELYKKTEASFWTTGEVKLYQDLSECNFLTDGERYFITNVIAVFLPSKTALSLKILLVPEAHAFYNFQIAMENVHSNMYNLLLDTYTQYLPSTIPTDMGTLQEDRGFILDDREVNLSRDLSQWNSLIDGEQYFITYVIAVFLPSETALSLKILLVDSWTKYRIPKPVHFTAFK